MFFSKFNTSFVCYISRASHILRRKKGVELCCNEAAIIQMRDRQSLFSAIIDAKQKILFTNKKFSTKYYWRGIIKKRTFEQSVQKYRKYRHTKSKLNGDYYIEELPSECDSPSIIIYIRINPCNRHDYYDVWTEEEKFPRKDLILSADKLTALRKEPLGFTFEEENAADMMF